MAQSTSKRKRTQTRTKPNKRPKYVDFSEGEPDDNSKLWEAECILEERIVKGTKKYHIKWRGTDPSTGKAWPATWEPEENANDELVADWLQRKAQRTAQEPGGSRGRSAQRAEAQTSRRIRNSRVIDICPESTTSDPSPLEPSTPSHNRAASRNLSRAANSPLGIATNSGRVLRVSPRIRIRRRGQSLERTKFERVSQLPLSQPPSTQEPTQAHSQETDLDHDGSQLISARPEPYSSGIVPDSQSSTGEASFIPITQQTEGINQKSTGSSRVLEDDGEEDLADDSGLLEIVQGAALQVISPTRSIPETIADTTVVDSQSQHQRVAAPGALELVQSLPQAGQVTTQDHRESETVQKPHTGALISTGHNTSSSDLLQQLQEHVPQTQTSTEAAENGPLEFVDIEEIPVSPRNSSALSDSQTSQTDRREANSDPLPIVTGASGEVTQPDAVQQLGGRDSSQPSLAERPVTDDDQSPSYSQYPITDFAQQAHSPSLASQPDCRIARCSSHQPAGVSATLEAQNSQALLTGPGAPNKTTSDPSYNRPHELVALPLNSQVCDNDLYKQLLTSKSIRSLSPASEAEPGPSYCLEEREQNAQVVSLEAVLSTQEDTADDIRITIEKDYAEDRANSESRHDSSQESPERPIQSLDHSSSPVPYPPSYSLKTQESQIPPRPYTPVPTSSASSMAGESSADIVKRQLEEALAKQMAENPYIPRKRPNRSSTGASVSVAEVSTTPAKASRLLRTAEQEGTRSPSAVPDRSPAMQVPTSLRTVAYAPSIPQAASPQDETMASTSGAHSETADADAEAAAATESAAPDVQPSVGSEDMDVSDADDEDSESLLNDDLQLAEQEFIIPLFIQGRQSDMYSQHIALKKDTLEKFLEGPHSVEPISQVEEILTYLRAIETHVDLVFAEAGSGLLNDEMSMTQAAHAAQFGIENSTKFRFLHKLFHHLRDSDIQKHIVLVTEKDDDALFNILETFCEAKNINYNMPTRGHRTDPTEVEGELQATIIPGNASPVMRPADLIICLDGFQDATQIRKKNWARSPEREVVPVIHLVIPRTVGHIERYIAPSLGPVERMHTILASLAHVRPDIGKAIDEDTPRDIVCASLVAEWLMDTTEGAEQSWPIPSIGSIKDVIEYQTQLSQPLANSPVPERIKRPLLDKEELDPSKRMRFTPQPQPVQSSGSDQNNETTRISDSMPSTAAYESNLQKRLAQLEEMYHTEREARRAEEKRFREHEEAWDKQQTVHENLAREYRLLLGKQQAAEKKLETLQSSNTTLTERLTTRTSELRSLEKQLEEQRATHLLSADAQIVEITKLRKDLATAHQEKEKAIKNAATTDNMLEYTRTAYQDAQKAAATANTRIADLEAQVTKLTHAASGQAVKLKTMHLDRNYEAQDRNIKALKAELGIVMKALQNKDEEITRLKSMGRPGVGTRGTSATPQPKIRSRAGSPSLVGGRLSNLRNG
ncbi:hypothetical protein COCMIDRAFT_91853 [Bipolaris oryzae ATCC 44560]|uniref:Chromo domain-containing protein n=1 Tax=Bipolaris oryzae ATCC 44560 TaxID=930090 RepID=W6Z9W8_COCMI|nr:uncharacterized protein COCMIDRAFT_91853 [Bipolaris oryzae ATCC 44560]EUC46780.1 hypothetical protein COCMIDRAFT_91853 [Bipolaris oryzae ATCC 44560]